MVGWIGATLLLFGWVLETSTTIKTESIDALNLKFVLLSLMGSTMLAAHSYNIGDGAFLFLNLSLAAIILVELGVYIYKSRVNL